MTKESLPLCDVYGLLEPGPVVLLTTAAESQANVMALSWHSMLEFEPPLISCVVSNRNYSFDLLNAAMDCVINIPTVEIAEKVVQCGNSTGATTDKFAQFGLTPTAARQVSAPLIDECHASLECIVVDTDMVEKYSLFVLQVVAAWINPAIEAPRTPHHLGYGRFMVAGEIITLESNMR